MMSSGYSVDLHTQQSRCKAIVERHLAFRCIDPTRATLVGILLIRMDTPLRAILRSLEAGLS